MNFIKTHLLIFVSALMLSGCATTDRTYGAAPEVEIADLTELPEPTVSRMYRLGPQEVVTIAVVGAESLSGTFLTDAQGNIEYPLLGLVPVAGMSPGEASRMIADGLRGDFLRNPQVRVIPKELPSTSISVGGEVEQPGNYPVLANVTLLRAVNQAGGLGEYAKHDDVLVMRTVNGQSYIGVYNIGAIQRGNYDDPRLYPDDIVMVGDSPGRRRLDRIVALVAPVISSTAVILNQLTR
uniref:polysaccharide biosynthesis/export family protein n=1 Tax=uncultured Erythrobacter sp. TaxID=263913 RepID=UPI0026102D50|nr:polysaccharide biosynthesis/export family protein [uncultured Erythrobacter sp.]